MLHMKARYTILFLTLATLASCLSDSTDTFQTPLLPNGINPSCVCHNGVYYYIQGNNTGIQIWETTDITKLQEAESKQIWESANPDSIRNIWAPDLQRIGDKWYIYFAGDDGNNANHHVYVLENAAEKPTEGTFTMKGMIALDEGTNWAMEPTSFIHQGKQYLVWAGQEGTPSQWAYQSVINLYIAQMENPWTLASEKVMISKPELEWEMEWINEDGTRTSKPYYCNESPAFTYSPDSTKLEIFFNSNSFSTVYHCVGVIYADADANLLDASSWTKYPEPIIMQNATDSIIGPGGLCFIPGPDKSETYMLFHARTDKTLQKNENGLLNTSPRIQKIIWDEKGIPSQNLLTGTK